MHSLDQAHEGACGVESRGEETLPPGTGPYRIAGFDRDRGARLVRNPYFRVWSAAARPDGLPDEIVARFSAAVGASVARVQRGQADVAIVKEVFGVGGLSPEAALKEAHKRVEDIYRIRSRG